MKTDCQCLFAAWLSAGVIAVLSGCVSTAPTAKQSGCNRVSAGLGSSEQNALVLNSNLTPSFALTLTPSIAGNSPGAVQFISVSDIANGCIVQEMDVSESELLSLSGAELEVFDMNFDGVDDIRYPLFRTAGPNTPYRHWLYDKQTQAFVNNEQLDELGALAFDAEKMIVTTTWRDGQRYGSGVYKAQGNSYVLVESIVTERDEQGRCKQVVENASKGTKVERACE